MPDTIGLDSRYDALSRAFDSALGFLAQRVIDPDFSTTVRVAFGGEVERKAIADFLHDALVDRDALHVKAIASQTLGGARAAYEAKTGTIYVSEELIAASTASPDALQRVLLEEIGHAIDARLNVANTGGDAAGDEGAIFAALILGENLSELALAALRAENDRGTIVVDGQAAAVEFAAAYGTVTLDGSAADWTAADRLEVPGSGTAGYELYGKFSGDAFVFALKSTTAVIGANTTFWLNTDQNTATGYKIWGFAGGSEYNVNFDGALPKLYTGGAGQTLVNAALDRAASADGKFVEFAVPVSMLAGAPKALDVLVDVNDSVFLPNDYSSYVYTVAAPVVTPPTPPVTGDITIDGDLSDWTAASRLELPGSGVAGYELYGKLVGDNYVFALKADTGQIGAATTFWLNTDQNAATGYQIWGFAGGAEYNVNFTSKPNLYTGAEGQTLVNGNLAHAFNAGHNIVEFAVPVSQLAGAPKAIDVQVDVNDQVYLPTDYSLYSYTVAAPQPPAPPPPPASDPSFKVAIVYSESTAANFYDLTNYSQLFMSAQYQATMAGVPFDVLSESDLTNVANLANYKAIIFPAFSHVAVDKVAAIEAALTSASKNYGVGLIAGGDFMTNNATGGVLSGDPYARMKSLLGVYRAGEGTGTVEVHAHDTTHSVMDGYQANELIRTYDNIGFSYFNGVGAASVLVDQQVGGQTYNGVLATTTGGNNVHFASDGLIGDNNLLWQAIQWAAKGTGHEIGLQMSRQSSIVASRTDMDQSQETNDVSPNSGPGIYDKLMPILAEWKAAYNFVGSYYINIGNNPPEQTTNWAVSKPYYQQMLALGNEIGTHSYTHPEDTNPLTASQIEYEFNQSQKVIEQQLGIDVVGAAVPGASEKLATSQAIIQYFDYLTGGFSSVGSGYPGAFGYLTPGNANSVYLAPNIEFDFSLVEFKGLTPAQAQVEWAKEWAQLTSHTDVPVVVWPWHDYAAATWMVDPPTQSPYTKAMFTSFIAAAAASGTEFVTLADLAQRIESFEKTKITYTTSGTVVTANVTGTDVGKFALDLDGGQTIKSVNGWYAYDNDSVFLPKNGGQFAINLGATPDDVTHIVALPSRGELLSVTGNGTNLNFSVKGDGKVIVDLKAPAGQTVVVTGAQIVSLVGDQLELALANVGQNDVSISFAPSGNFPPVITSNGGADTASVSIAENGLAVTTVKASAQGGGTVHYAIDGGADANAFTIDANSGALKFKTAPDFETPTDAGANNIYDVLVKAIDGAGLIDTQSLSVKITDVAGVTLTGNGSANTLNGGTENDTLNGAGGNDTLNGLGGNDTLLGGAGADTLIGGLGNDRLEGGAGNDLLTGGPGVDIMIGGAGNDRFIFGSASDIGTIAAHDVITDFVRGQDRLDLSALDANSAASGNQAFQFLTQPGAAFTGAGQLHFVHDTAKNVTYVEGNMDANLTADFRLELNGILQLRSTDFVL